MIYKFFDKKLKGSGVSIAVKPCEQLSEESQKPIIRNFRKRTVYSEFKNKIWGADLADMQLISKFDRGFRFLLYVIDIFSNMLRLFVWKIKKSVSIINAFKKISKESNKKENKMWTEKESEFYNNSFKKWLKDDDIEMYSTHKEEKYVVAERFVRT